MSDQLPPELEGIDLGEHLGVRTLYVRAESAALLADQIAVAIGEYCTDDDELHLSYSTQQVAWENHPGQAGGMFKQRQDPFTQLYFEYSAMIVLRPRPAVRIQRDADRDEAD